MITVEFNIKYKNEVIISLDYHGLVYFLNETRRLRNECDDVHFWAPSWAGKDLNEYNLSGEHYHWIPKLTIASMDSNNLEWGKEELGLYVEKTPGNEYTVELVGTLKGICYFLDQFSKLNLRYNNQSTDIEIKNSVLTEDPGKKESFRDIKIQIRFLQ